MELVHEAEEYQQTPRSLFQGEAAQAMAQVAPYLVALDPASAYLESWVEWWGNNAGVLLTTAVDEPTLFQHLRSVFVVQDETGQEHFFRYYDPRVLRVFLPTCSPGEKTEFFGPVSCYFVEGTDPESLLTFRAL